MKHKKPKIGTIVEIIKSGNRYNAWDKDGNKLTSYIRTSTRKSSHRDGKALELREGKGGRTYWWKVSMEKFGKVVKNAEIPTKPTEIEIPDDHEEVVGFIKDSSSLKTKGIVLSELK